MKEMGYRRRFYRRGFSYGRGYNFGYGVGFGRGYASYGDPTKCARFPDLPRWWWVNSETRGISPVPSVNTEKEYLEGSMKLLEQELVNIKKRLTEIGTEDKPL